MSDEHLSAGFETMAEVRDLSIRAFGGFSIINS